MILHLVSYITHPYLCSVRTLQLCFSRCFINKVCIINHDRNNFDIKSNTSVSL